MTNDEAIDYLEHHEFILPLNVCFFGRGVTISVGTGGITGFTEGENFVDAVQKFTDKHGRETRP